MSNRASTHPDSVTSALGNASGNAQTPEIIRQRISELEWAYERAQAHLSHSGTLNQTDLTLYIVLSQLDGRIYSLQEGLKVIESGEDNE